MFKTKRAAPPSVVGLEIDPGHVAAAEVDTGAGLRVTRGAVAPLAPGVLRDGDVADGEALAAALRTLFDEHELPRTVRIGIANQRIVVRTVDVPAVDDGKALRASVLAVAADHIPIPIEDAVLDFQPVGTVETPAGARTRVVLVAVRRETVERLAATAELAGLRIAGIDLSAFGAVRALRTPVPGEAVLVIAGAGLVNVAVASASGCLFTRAAAGGLDTMAATLADARALTLEHAHQWLCHVGLAAPVEDLDGDPAVVAAARAVLDDGVHALADTVRNSLNFYRMQEHAEPVERALLTGPATDVAGLAERLGELLRLPVAAASAPLGAAEDIASRITVAAGLAVVERP